MGRWLVPGVWAGTARPNLGRESLALEEAVSRALGTFLCSSWSAMIIVITCCSSGWLCGGVGPIPPPKITWSVQGPGAGHSPWLVSVAWRMRVGPSEGPFH